MTLAAPLADTLFVQSAYEVDAWPPYAPPIRERADWRSRPEALARQLLSPG